MATDPLMNPTTVLQLGTFSFGSLEVPAEIGFGGAQRLSVHELVGGTRVVDAMGRSDRPLSWSGLLLGEQALQRARFLDGLRIAGASLELSWSELRYLVVVREFDATFQRAYQIPYRISCEVVADLAAPVTSPGTTPVDEQVNADAAQATELVAEVGDSRLTGLMGTLNSAIKAVSSFAHAAQSTISSVLQPLAAVQAQVTTLIASTANTISNVTTFGGVLPNNPLATSAARLTGQLTAVTQGNSLYALRNVLGRMSSNLGAVNAPQATIGTAGGNLFRVAQQQYGDPMAWTGIARANGLTDPFVQGAQVLTIPPNADDSAGVLSA